jgi:hypothetical protein
MSDRRSGNHGDGPVAVELAQPSLTATQKALVKEQLARVLASPLFSHSRRFPDFLRYTVNRALDEDTDSIKERTLGVEVFGRDPNYDTSLDPVVRMTAVEVRKRLAQYYQLPNHELEPRIDFARGSYVPEFHFPDEQATQDAAGTAQAAETASEPKPWRKSKWLVAACVIVPSLLISSFLLGSTTRTGAEIFWSPVIASKSPVLVCMPDLQSTFPTSTTPQPPTLIQQQISGLPVAFKRDRVSFGDSIAMSEIAGFLGSKAKDFHIRHTEDVDLGDLKEGPVILIGGYSNQWAMQLDSELRYSFVKDGNVHYIRDAQNPNSRQWTEPNPSDGNPPTSDYAIVSRVLDPTTGRIVIMAAGIHQFGTQAAGECITDSTCIEQAEKLVSGDWTKANVEILLQTTVIGDNPGKARVLAATMW